MLYKDRTKEFQSIITSFKSFSENREGGLLMSAPSMTDVISPSMSALTPTSEHKTEFGLLSQKIGHEIYRTMKNVDELNEIVTHQSLFENKSSEIQEHSNTIKKDLTTLNYRLLELQKLKPEKGISNDSKEHCHQIVIGLQIRLASLSENFKNILTLQTKKLESFEQRKQKFDEAGSYHQQIDNSSMTSYLPKSTSSSIDKSSKPSHITIEFEEEIPSTNYPQSKALLKSNSFDDSVLETRSKDISQIENTIAELVGAFHKLAELVSFQNEQVQRIDANVGESQLNIEAAHLELLKYFRNISSNRWLMFKLFSLLLVFMVIFIWIV